MKATPALGLTPYDNLQMHRSAKFWIPKLMSFAEISAWILLLFSVVTVVTVFFSFPLPYVVAVTESGVVFNVPVR